MGLVLSFFFLKGRVVGECWGHRKAKDLWETGIWNIQRYFFLVLEADYLKENMIIYPYSFSVLRVKTKIIK